MHVRFSTTLGMPILEEYSREKLATISGILFNPDEGKVEGFYVYVPAFFRSEELFLHTSDIAHWGTTVRIRSIDVLAPLDDIVRLRAAVSDGRTVLGQRIMTDSGVYLGRCKDVQFHTTTFAVEWLFPRKGFRLGVPIPSSAIVNITSDAIIVRDAITLPEVSSGPSVLGTIDPLRTT